MTELDDFVPSRTGKRVGIVCGQFPKLSETFVMDQVFGLLRKGFDVRVYAREHSIEEVRHSISVDLIAETHYPKRRSLWWIWPRKVRRRIERLLHKQAVKRLILEATQECDLVLCHFGPEGLRAVKAVRGSKTAAPIWTIFHGYDVSSYIKTYGMRVYEELFAKGARFLPISEFWARRLAGLGCPPAKTSVLHMGVDAGAIGYNPRPLDASRPIRLLFVGRLVPKKGSDVLLKALAYFRDESPNAVWEATLVGDGGMRSELEALALNLGLSDRVVFCGPLPSDEVRQMLTRADFFALPSYTAENGDMEGIPVALMEAMAAGVPVITTAHSGIPELVEDGVSGFLAKEADSQDLKRRIVEAFSQSPSARQAMQLAARAKIEREFDQAKLLDQLSKMISPEIAVAPEMARSG